MHDHPHPPSYKRSWRLRVVCAVMRGPLSGNIAKSIGGRLLKHLPGQITCRQFEDFVVDYVEGRLSENQLKLFNRHIALCPFCGTSLAAYVKAIEMGQAVCKEEEKDQAFLRAPQELIDAIIDVTTGKD